MNKKKIILGWIGVGITILFSSFWAYWGAFENFHEGWYSTSIWENLFLLLFQYLLFTTLFVLLALITLKWKKPGLILHILLGILGFVFFSGSHIILRILIITPTILLGLLYYLGNPQPKKWAYRLIISVPLIIILAISIPLGYKVSQRTNDGNFNLRIVEGNQVTLAWAPRGPGWPDEGKSWQEAQDICDYLSEDGLVMMEEKQHIWRLPTVDEIVRSMAIHGNNSGGTWSPETEKATYVKKPDKETPLWDMHSKVIYYWTADTAMKDDQKAYIMTYHGGVFTKKKTDCQVYQSFRAVKNVN